MCTTITALCLIEIECWKPCYMSCLLNKDQNCVSSTRDWEQVEAGSLLERFLMSLTRWLVTQDIKSIRKHKGGKNER